MDTNSFTTLQETIQIPMKSDVVTDVQFAKQQQQLFIAKCRERLLRSQE